VDFKLGHYPVRAALAAAPYLWSSDFLPPKSSENNGASKPDAPVGDFARGYVVSDDQLS
jgi:hypothetical protein